MTYPFQARIAREAVVVEGPDATSFLQSLVSQDLDPIAIGGSAHALLLQPQGKLLADFYAVRTADETWWCVCEAGVGAELAAGLNRFKIRVKADVREEPVAALALRGAEPPSDPGGAVVFPVDWDGRAAFDAVGPSDAVDALSAAVAVPLVDATEYEIARIEAGVPRQGLDTDERTIPQEAGLERSAVSFTKGCFVGQELVCRIDTRGHVNRYLRRLRSEVGELQAGVTVTDGDREVGTVTSASGVVALAMLRREVEPASVVDAGGVTALVEAI
jgi:folate-binding protein YgfZ